MSNDLKPCPFCGGIDIVAVSNVRPDGEPDSLQCVHCGASSGVYDDEESATVAWERRTPSPDVEEHRRAWASLRVAQERAIPALDAAKEVLPRDMWLSLAALIYTRHEPFTAAEMERLAQRATELAAQHGWSDVLSLPDPPKGVE